MIALPFDATIANQSYENFFKYLRNYLPFDQLIVGEDARFGKGRAGGPEEIKALEWNTEYLPKETYHKEPISSGVIRRFLEKREFKKVRKMSTESRLHRLGKCRNCFNPLKNWTYQKTA